MSMYETDEGLSDDEVFIGKFTFKELKKHILWDKHPNLCTVSAVSSPKEANNLDTSLKLLQTHSEPNLRPAKCGFDPNTSEVSSEWDVKDDSFVKMENMVAKLCMSPNNTKKTEELNNTLEVIEYILNNPPGNDNKIKTEVVEHQKQEEANVVLKEELNNEIPSVEIEDDEPLNTDIKPKCETKVEPLPQTSPPKSYYKTEKVNTQDSMHCPQNTPVKSNTRVVNHVEGCFTPRGTQNKPNFKTPIFKTPGKPVSVKKPFYTPVKKTPSKLNAYQHITSPVASYIKNCPMVPLVKDVHPKKPLPGSSCIPKLKTPATQSNKENINLPSIAYKSAKKTKVIDIPDEKKLPQSEWAKKIMNSLPRPVVIKHDHREMNLAKKRLMSQQENSFDDLSFRQAEVSVCMQKTAFKFNKNV